MTTRYDTYCGLYCGACALLVARERGELEKLAESEKLQLEQVQCRGCKSDEIALFCKDCSMRSCALDRNLDSCGDCPEYPCDMLLNFKNDQYAHHSVVLTNLEFIKEQGLDNWLLAQEKRWRCPSCGTKFSWYDELCSQCSAQLYNCVSEDNE